MANGIELTEDEAEPIINSVRDAAEVLNQKIAEAYRKGVTTGSSPRFDIRTEKDLKDCVYVNVGFTYTMPEDKE